MLCLSRRRGQAIHITPDIEVTILSIRGRTVQLGIRAPATTRIDRREVRERRLGATKATHGYADWHCILAGLCDASGREMPASGAAREWYDSGASAEAAHGNLKGAT